MGILLNLLKTMGVTVGKTLFASLVSRKMMIFMARMSARRSDTLVDDRIVDLVDYASKGDKANTEKAFRKLIKEWGK